MNPNKRKNIFELFGFDFLLDEDFRLWLIEINTNPYLGTPSKEMATVVPRMIDDLLKITLDPVMKPKNQPDQEQNGFDLIYREQSWNDPNGPPAVNHRRPFNLNLCYPIPELKPFIGKIAKKDRAKKEAEMRKQAVQKKADDEKRLATPSTEALQTTEAPATPTTSGSTIPTKP